MRAFRYGALAAAILLVGVPALDAAGVLPASAKSQEALNANVSVMESGHGIYRFTLEIPPNQPRVSSWQVVSDNGGVQYGNRVVTERFGTTGPQTVSLDAVRIPDDVERVRVLIFRRNAPTQTKMVEMPKY